MRFRAKTPPIRQGFVGSEQQIGLTMVHAMTEAGDGLKEELRDQVRASGLGNRLANTWRARTYPVGRASLDPAAYIWSKAPKLVDAFDRGVTIFPTGGRRYLAIPTDNVPMKGRNQRMTPLDVEVSFNQDLITRKDPRTGHILCFVNVVQSKNRRGWRKATGRRLAQGRAVKLVLMFTLVRQTSLRKRLDIQGAADRWAAKVPSLIAAAGI